MTGENELILDVLKRAFVKYRKEAIDWVITEVQAQAKLYSIFNEMYNEYRINVITSDIAYPEFETISPIRMEYKIKDSNGESRRLDIAILNDAKEIDLDVEKEKSIDEMVRLFVEVKVGWGYCSGQFNGEGIMKDLKLINLYRDRGYLFYFIGNEYSKMYRKHIEAYRKSLKYYSENYNYNNLFIIFVDGVFKYDVQREILEKQELGE